MASMGNEIFNFQFSIFKIVLFGILLSIVLGLVLIMTPPVQAATKASPTPSSERLKLLEKELATVMPATASATASAQKEATVGAQVKKVVEKQPDLTEPKPEVQGKLEKYLREQVIEPLSFKNPLKHAIRLAVVRGVPANTIVLILLFPLVGAWVAFARHVIGLAGFGIFTPAILAVVFLATGVFSGLGVFVVIIVAATAARLILRHIKLQYLPRMAFLLWFVSLSVFGLLLGASYLPVAGISVVSIFPILILILLAETFMEVQVKEGMKQATTKTLITILVAIAGYGILKLEPLQKFVLLQPELAVILVGLFDMIIGKYGGLRLLEYYRFRRILQTS